VKMKAIAVLLCLALATTAVSGQADPFSFIPNTNAVALAGFKASEALAGGDCSAIDALYVLPLFSFLCCCAAVHECTI